MPTNKPRIDDLKTVQHSLTTVANAGRAPLRSTVIALGNAAVDFRRGKQADHRRHEGNAAEDRRHTEIKPLGTGDLVDTDGRKQKADQCGGEALERVLCRHRGDTAQSQNAKGEILGRAELQRH